MKKIIIALICVFYSLSLFSNENTWYSFWNKDETLMGFKDIDGNIKIEPKYVNIISSGKFDYITIVIEKVNEEYISYYLTTTGKQIFKPIYMYDNSLDSQSEGFIRFRDTQNDTVGMLDKNGNVVIPPIYNDLKKVKNGMVVALKGAKKEYWDSHQEEGCNHFSWKGGKEYLIDTNNRILVEDYTYKSSFDLFSIKKSSQPSEVSSRVSFLGHKGIYYSLIDLEKEFEEFVKNELLVELSLEKLIKHSYSILSFGDDELRVQFASNSELLPKYFSEIKDILSTLNLKKTDYFISHRERHPFFSDDKRYNLLKQDIEQMEKTTYAHFAIIINHEVNGYIKQDQFYFLKIGGQYKLIDTSLFF